VYRGKIWQFIKLTRPVFLLGGIMLYALGAAFAWSQGFAIHPLNYLLGQLLVTATQLMTHYANEYYDQECDRYNTLGRTWFSGGSGILASGALAPQVVRRASLWMAFTALGFLVVIGFSTPILFVLGAASLLGAWFYSAPPLSLVSTGWGELTTSLIVALFVPLVGYAQQTGGQIHPSLLLACIPLVLVHLTMLIAFSIPDLQADQQVGKRTLVVRLGREKVILVHNLLLLLAVAACLLVGSWGISMVRFAWIALPLMGWQAVTIYRYRYTPPPPYLWLTLRAIGLFAFCSFLWLIGVVIG
jgi:1,4-dihydroxy-2-naphthoate octaprenyltransferase